MRIGLNSPKRENKYLAVCSRNNNPCCFRTHMSSNLCVCLVADGTAMYECQPKRATRHDGKRTLRMEHEVQVLPVVGKMVLQHGGCNKSDVKLALAKMPCAVRALRPMSTSEVTPGLKREREDMDVLFLCPLEACTSWLKTVQMESASRDWSLRVQRKRFLPFPSFTQTFTGARVSSQGQMVHTIHSKKYHLSHVQAPS